MKNINRNPPPDELRDRIYYEDGQIYWNPDELAKDRRKKSEPLGYEVGRSGYVGVGFRGEDGNRKYYIHRLVYWLNTGEWPEEIDHLDGDKANNHISNLRPATRKQNSQNKNKQSNNTSGYVGVTFLTGKYRAQIKIDGKYYASYGYETAEAAAVARDILTKLFYGEFANFNLLDKPTLSIN